MARVRRKPVHVLAGQLELFGDFVAPVRPAANEPIYQRLALVPAVPVDLPPPLDLTDEDLEDAEIDVGPPAFTHTLVRAADCQIPKGLGPASVFCLGAGAALAKRHGRSRMQQSDTPVHRVIVREDGRLIHQSIRVQETDEWKEKEERRRARQKPPKPPKQKFKTKGSRVWADARN